MFRVLLFLLISLFISCHRSSEISIFDEFHGRWSLHIVEQQQDSLSAWTPRGGSYEGRQGYIIYDGLGGMGVHHVPGGYENYVFEGVGGLDNLTENDLKHLANNFVYFGEYKVIDSLQIIEHHIESSQSPALWGTVTRRKYVFSGDTLILNPVTSRYPKIRLKWVRINPK
jgi:hypothetical protein